ncbi:MAG: AMP-binding protein, partial [Acidobacteria bacterium]|nr:AMP-binding protein [Acidobacteriota bacterium]
MRPHLASLVKDLRRHGPQTAVVTYPGVRRHATTYAQLAELAARFAAELDRRSILPGDRVILWGENSAPWIAAFFGCLLRGVLVVPLDAAGSPDFAARVIADTAPRLILADTAHLPSLPSAIPQLSLNTLAETLATTRPNFGVSTAVTLDSPFQIVFTSGTTGTPKGIVHTHRNVLASLDPIEREIAKYRRYERPFHPLRFLHSLPLSHVFGQFMGLWIPPILAAELHLESQLEPARLLDRIRLNRISVLVAVPRTLDLLRSHLLNRFPGLDTQLAAATGLTIARRIFRFRRVHRLTGWKFWALISGGATLPPDLELFWGRLGFALIQGYGMTETAALITLNHPFHLGRGTLGKPLPGREVRLSPDGEILVRGDVVSTATWTNGRLQPSSSDWLATGDLATQDTSGDLRFTGRLGDAIVTSAGLNIHPSDLEAALLQHPSVRAAAVIPCPTPTGPEPIAVLLTNTADADLGQILHTANQHLAPYQHLRRALPWPEPSFPFTSTGKLLRRSIAEWACQQIASSPAAPTSTRTDPLLDAIASITRQTPSNTADTARLTEDLHLDSLGLVQLQSLLEQRFGLDLSDDQIAHATTLGDLRTLLHTPASSPVPASAAVPPTIGDQTSAPRPTATQQPQPAPIRPCIPQDHRYPLWPWLAPVNLLRVLFQDLILLPLTHLLAAPRLQSSAQPTAK